MSEPATQPRCENCGGPIRRDNVIGICRRNPECERARVRKERQKRGPRPKPPFKACKHPDGCSKRAVSEGWCGMHRWRIEKYGDPGPAETLRRRRIVHAGDTFGYWTALEDYTEPAQLRIMCRCECGSERRIAVDTLLGGHIQSCGCADGRPRSPKIKRKPYLRTGEVYALLTVLVDVGYSTDWAECRCECGTEVKRRAVSVKSGVTRSCGCLRRKHGLAGHPLYNIWMGIVRRTTNPDDKDYPAYGGRGVGLCERWQGMPEGFLNFVADMGERSPGTSVERTENDLGYSPENCEWATWSQQSRNQRTVGVLTREIAELRAQNAALTAQLAARD